MKKSTGKTIGEPHRDLPMCKLKIFEGCPLFYLLNILAGIDK
jgi:hypothetical protein